MLDCVVFAGKRGTLAKVARKKKAGEGEGTRLPKAGRKVSRPQMDLFDEAGAAEAIEPAVTSGSADSRDGSRSGPARRSRLRAGPAGHRPDDGPEAAGDLGLRVLREEPPPARVRQPAQGAPDRGARVRGQLPRRLQRGRHPAHAAHPRGPARRGPLPRSRSRTTGPGSCASRSPASSGSSSTAASSTPSSSSGASRASASPRPGMYGQLTTGKPVHIMSRTGPRTPAHLFEITVDTKRNEPLVLKDEVTEWDTEAGDQGRDRARGDLQEGPAVGGRLRRADRAGQPPHRDLLHARRSRRRSTTRGR